MKSTKRDLLVNTALQLFTQNGYRSTGIDKILAESGVAKMTLYKYFKSKDELIIAALSQREQDFMSGLHIAIKKLTEQQHCDPRLARLMAFFDVLGEWINSDEFCGCNFINACIEFKRQDDPIHVAAAAHKKLMLQLFQELLAELRLQDVQKVARQIQILVEGCIVMAVTTGDKDTVLLAKESILALLGSFTFSPPLLSFPTSQHNNS